MPSHLIQSLMAVLLATGVLLILDSGRPSAPDPSFHGDQLAVCADELTSANDPEIPLLRSTEHPAEVGCYAPFPSLTPQPATAQPRSANFARAPPAV
jgi:hypothetical protein